MDSLNAEQEVLRAAERSTFYKLLAKALMYPLPKMQDDVRRLLAEEVVVSPAGSETSDHVLNGKLRAFNDAVVSLDSREERMELEQEYNRMFSQSGSTGCPPHETEYGYENIFQKTQAMADIAGFYSAYGIEVSDTNTERVDFIGTELQFMAYLTLNEAYAIEAGDVDQLEICRDVQRKFLRDHLGRWVDAFTQALRGKTSLTYYSTLSDLLNCYLRAECRMFQVEITELATLRPIEAKPVPFGCEACLGDQESVTEQRGG